MGRWRDAGVRHGAGRARRRSGGRVAVPLGLPLGVVETTLRELPARGFSAGEDMRGAALPFLAASLGTLRRVIVPATNSTNNVLPCGTSPLLDPLFSTERVEVVHDSILRGRNQKIDYLAGERPEALRVLKVCYQENRPDNCGRCRKCLLTMAALAAAGALRAAEQVPDRLEPELLRAVPFASGLPSP